MTEPSEPPILDKIRSMWEFAAVAQFFNLFYYMFGLNDFDIYDFEQELIGIKEPNLIPLARLRLLQGLTSNRAITLENLDEFTRKQFIKRKPDANPFGDEENPTSWEELDVFAHIRVLRLLQTWQFDHPDKFRERADAKDYEQLSWRVEPIGYDANGNIFYLFDDNRLYYRDAPVIPEDLPTRKKFRGKKRKRGARRIESEEPEPTRETNGQDVDEDMTWHIKCITLEDYQEFVARLKKSRDPDEKALYRHLQDDIMPKLIEEEEERARERERREQEYLRQQAYAARKRSNRLVQKEEDRKLMEEREVEMAKKRAEEEERKREEQRLKKLEQEREARLLLREQRQREREFRIQQREEERKRALEEAEQAGKPITIKIKMSSQSPAPQPKKTSRQQALESQRETVEPQSQPPPSEESWFFDCICGKHGTNYDDGGYTVACEKCEIWQHVDCLPNSQDKEELLKRKDVPEGTYPDYEFICTRCRKKAKEASKTEAVKSKEQMRKERERELNRAKYARRKEREKARKEEERRKREEEQRLGLANGELASSPMGELHGLGVSSSPVPASSSPDRAPMTTGQLYTLPTYPPAKQNSPLEMPYSHQQQVPYFNQNSIQSPAGQYQQHQHGAISTPNTTFAPANQQTPVAHQQVDRSGMSQGQPPRQSSQYPPVRPAIQPYWSPYTTSPTLPNGQTFPETRPHSAPYMNGFLSSTPRARNIASKPPANTQYDPYSGGYPPHSPQQQLPQEQQPSRPSLPTTSQSTHLKSPELQRQALPTTQNNSYSKQQQAQRLSQAPAIQPRPSKSPDTQRPLLPNSENLQQAMYASQSGQGYPHHPSNLQAIQPRPSKSPEHIRSSPPQATYASEFGQTYQKPLPVMPSPPSQRIPSPIQSKNIVVPQSSQSQPKPPSSTALAPATQSHEHTQRHSIHEGPIAQAQQPLTSPLPTNRPENQNELGPGPEKQMLANTPNIAVQMPSANMDGNNTGAGSGVLEDDSEKDQVTLAKENERTKMAFLLN